MKKTVKIELLSHLETIQAVIGTIDDQIYTAAEVFIKLRLRSLLTG